MNDIDATQRPLRADAQRNQARILAAAREVFAQRGFDASLDEVAAHAGVGVGTVYRRFPDKDALIEALFEHRVAEIADVWRRALERDDPWEAFCSALHEAHGRQASDRGLKQALLFRGRHSLEHARERITPLAAEVIARAQQTGRLRADLDVADLPVITWMINAISDLTCDVSPELWQRMLTIVLDGLVTSRAEPTRLPSAPLDRDELATAIAERGRR